jgi:hypothetical protein
MFDVGGLPAGGPVQAGSVFDVQFPPSLFTEEMAERCGAEKSNQSIHRFQDFTD